MIKLKMQNRTVEILTGDFNCRSTQFWPGDIDSLKGIALDELIESNNMTQLIDQPTNLEPRGSLVLI